MYADCKPVQRENTEWKQTKRSSSWEKMFRIDLQPFSTCLSLRARFTLRETVCIIEDTLLLHAQWVCTVKSYLTIGSKDPQKSPGTLIQIQDFCSKLFGFQFLQSNFRVICSNIQKFNQIWIFATKWYVQYKVKDLNLRAKICGRS